MLEQYFDLRDAGSEDGLETGGCHPKAKEAIFQRVRIGMAGKLLMTMEIRQFRSDHLPALHAFPA